SQEIHPRPFTYFVSPQTSPGQRKTMGRVQSEIDIITGMDDDLPGLGDLVAVQFPLDLDLVGILRTGGHWRRFKTPGRPGLDGLAAVEPDLGICRDLKANTDGTLRGFLGGRCTVVFFGAGRTVI